MILYRRLRACILMCLMLYFAHAKAQTTWYVDGLTGNDLSSGRGGWSNAKKDLQAAIQSAGEGDRIWVAEGVYYPTAIPDSASNIEKGLSQRDRCFHIPKYLEIFGGFKGNETELTQRNWMEHPTILSGDIGEQGMAEDNAYHVVIISGVKTARLDGFIISGGNADGNSAIPLKVSGIQQGLIKKYDVFDDKGGGMHIINAPTTLENFVVRNCFSDGKGGGIFITQSPSTIRNAVITQNSSEDAEGGGIYFERTKNTLTQCVIAENDAYKGGGIYALADSLNMINCLILGNSAEVAGAGVHSGAYSDLIMNGCTVFGNTIPGSGKGAGVFVTQTDTKILNSIIQRNTVRGSITGAGTDIDSSFLGGRFSIDFSFTQNTWSGSQNSTEPAIFFNPSDAIGADLIWKTGDDGFIPVPSSAVIGKGQPSSNLTDDITGLVRGNSIDIGAYQYNPCQVYNKILFVNARNDNPVQNGAAWETAFSQLQDALDIVNQGCGSRVKEIWVAAGTYIPDRFPSTDSSRPSGKAFLLLKDVRLLGGFEGNESNTANRDFLKNKTVLSGQLNDTTQASQVLIVSGLGVNTFISGFFIEKGDATQEDLFVSIGSKSIHTINGAGLYCDSSFASFEDIHIGQNNAINGAGIYVFKGKPVFRNCTLNDNQALNAGGALFAKATDIACTNLNAFNNTAEKGGAISTESCGFATFTRVILENNSAIKNGGAYYGINGTIRMSTAVFRNNSAPNGGAMFIDQAHRPLIENVLFLENSAFRGGASAQFNGFAEFTNCNFIGNQGQDKAGAVYAESFGNLKAVNCIFQNNTLNDIINLPSSDVFSETNVGTSLDHSLFQSVKPGNNNTTGNPGFYRPFDYLGSDGRWFTEDDGMMLLKTSQCVGSGNPDIRPGRDITGRPQRLATDIGAYLSYCGADSDTILFVDGNNQSEIQDGRSWATAYSDLQRALNATLYSCVNVRQVWVKEGEYFPTIVPDSALNELKGIPMSPRFRTFALYDNLQLFGGFRGSEIRLSERNITEHPTVLSGDIGVRGDASDNVLHLITLAKGNIAASTIIDGFTLEDGNANINGRHYFKDSLTLINDSCGGAVYAAFAGATIRNGIIKNHQAHSGGAIYSTSNTLRMDEVTFENNKAQNGGAMALVNDNIYAFSNLSFQNNQAMKGGAIYVFQSPFQITRSVFEENSALLGGAIYQEICRGTQLSEVIFSGNQAKNGGAFYQLGGSTSISNGLFMINSASDTAGAGYLDEGQLTIRNTTFYQNTSNIKAGAIFQSVSRLQQKLQLFNNIFSRNSVNGDSTISDADIMIDPANFSVTHSFSNTFSCDTCFTGLPLFLAPNDPKGEDNLFYTPDDGFNLQLSSPLLNKGQWSSTPSRDMTGYAKGIHFADPGPYKSSPCITHQYTERLYVKAGQNPSFPDGKSWSTAYTDLQQALDVANAVCANIQEIWVAQGVYTPSQYPDSLYNAQIQSIHSPTQKAFFLTGKIAVYGGFSGNETALDQRKPDLYRSELLGLYEGVSDTTQKTGHVLIISGVEDVLLDGLHFQYSSPKPSTISVNNNLISNLYGGGLHISKASVTLRDNVFSELNAQGGGAVYGKNSQIFAQNNHFLENTASWNGGAVELDSAKFFSNNNHFLRNAVSTTSSDFSGGAIHLRRSQMNSFGDIWEENFAFNGGAFSAKAQSVANISNGVFHLNRGLNFGGAINLRDQSVLELNNLLLVKNSAFSGGAIYTDNTFKANAVTCYANTANDVGGAICTSPSAQTQIQLQNILFADNQASNGGRDFYRGVGNVYDVQYSLLQDSFPGNGNIVGINRFRDTSHLIGPDSIWMTHDDGVNLAIGSDAINNGNSNAPANDIAGYPRKSLSDIGAYEYSICNDYETVDKLYVNVANTNLPQDGLSWETAFSRLQDAIQLTTFPCVIARKIWVAQGTYYPEYIPDEAANIAAGITLNDRRKTYWIPTRELQIFGGFAEGDTSMLQRDPSSKPTIINGDIGVPGNPADNSIHLMVLHETADGAVLDGLQFRNAYANTNGSFIVNGRRVDDRYGAIVANSLRFEIRNGVLSANYATSGAGVFVSDAKLTLTNVDFSDHFAEVGAAVYLNNTQAKFTSSRCFNNRATSSGAAVFSTNRSAIEISASVFSANKAPRGGSIDQHDKSNLTIKGAIFEADSAQNGASINLENGTSLAIYQSSVNNSQNGNGAIRSDGASLIIEEVEMSGNISFENGAALNVFGSSSIQLYKSSFRNNSTIGRGGAVYLDAPVAQSFIKNCQFDGNHADYNGGAIKINNRQNDFGFENNSFAGNTAKQAGGAVSVEDGFVLFNKAEFENNKATYGGAVNIFNAFNQCQFNQCTFEENTALKAGGAVFLSASPFYMQLSASIFERNQAEKGAAYFGAQGGRSNILSCVFYNNQATESGGSIYIPLKYADSKVQNTLFIENNAKEKGGAIYVERDAFHYAVNNTYYMNDAASEGAAHFHEENVQGVAFNNIFRLNSVNGDTSVPNLRKNIYLTSLNGYGINHNVMDSCWILSWISTCSQKAETGFIDEDNYKGDDGIWLTSDDGLIPGEGSNIEGLGVAISSNVPALEVDILGLNRNGMFDPGAYKVRMLSTGVYHTEEWKINVFPNPFKNWLQLTFEETPQEEIRMQLLDIKGRVLLNTQHQPMNTTIRVSLPEHLSSGMYVLLLKSAGKQASVLLAKE